MCVQMYLQPLAILAPALAAAKARQTQPHIPHSHGLQQLGQQRSGAYNLLDWVSGCVLIYGVLFGIGKLLLGNPSTGILLLLAGAAGGAVIYWDLSRRGWSSVVD